MALLRNQSDKVGVVAGIPLFAGLTRKELAAIARHADEVAVAEGAVIAQQGEWATEVAVILDGAAVVRRNGRKVATVGKGDIVGEIGLVTNRPRNATVVATRATTLLVIERRAFQSVLDDLPGVARKVLATVAERLADDVPGR